MAGKEQIRRVGETGLATSDVLRGRAGQGSAFWLIINGRNISAGVSAFLGKADAGSIFAETLQECPNVPVLGDLEPHNCSNSGDL